jgi:hypothetical protein
MYRDESSYRGAPMRTARRFFTVLLTAWVAIGLFQTSTAADTNQFRATTLGARASFFNTCSVPVCTNFIIATSTRSVVNGTRTQISQICAPIPSDFMCGDATVSVNGGLSSATASGTIPVTICSTTGCSESTVTVSATWTAVGDRERTHQHPKFPLEQGKVIFNDTFVLRDATATATLNGVSLGTSRFAEIFRGHEGEVVIVPQNPHVLLVA